MSLASTLALLCFVAVGLPDGMLGVAWPSMRMDLGRPLDGLGQLIVAWSAGYLVASASAGAWLARFGFAAVLVVSTLGLGGGVAAYAIASAWPTLLVASVVAGAGGGAIDAGINAWMALRRGAGALNVLHGCYGLGASLGPGAVAAGLALGSWRLAYAGVGALLVLLAIGIAWGRSAWDGRSEVTPAGSSRRALGVPGVWAGVAAFFLYVGVEVGAAQWAYSLLVEARQVSDGTAAATVSAFWIVFTASRFLFGAIARGRSLRRLLLGSLATALAGTAALALARGGAASAAALALLGLGLAPVFPLLVAITPDRVGRELAPAAIGLQVAGATVGGALVPAGLGLLAARFGLELVPAALLGCTLVLLVGCGALAGQRAR